MDNIKDLDSLIGYVLGCFPIFKAIEHSGSGVNDARFILGLNIPDVHIEFRLMFTSSRFIGGRRISKTSLDLSCDFITITFVPMVIGLNQEYFNFDYDITKQELLGSFVFKDINKSDSFYYGLFDMGIVVSSFNTNNNGYLDILHRKWTIDNIVRN